MLQEEHSAILSTFIKLPFVIKSFVLSIFEWPFYTGFTVFSSSEFHGLLSDQGLWYLLVIVIRIWESIAGMPIKTLCWLESYMLY